jgi:hypothetical protein
LGEIVGALLDEVAENGLIIVADEEDLLDLGYFGDGTEAVLNYGVAGNVEERL